MTTYIIYNLKNTNNEKVYIGQTRQTLAKRWHRGYEGCTHIQRAIEKYGKDTFYYETLAICYNQEEADYLEDYFINHLNSRDVNTGYNIRKGGTNAPITKTPWNSGTKGKGICKANAGSFKKGQKQSPEMIAKRAKSQTGIKRSAETLIKMSKSMSGKLVGEKNPNFGKPRSKETKEKISQSQIGKPKPITAGADNGNSKLTNEQVAIIRNLLEQNFTHQSIADKFNVSRGTISNIKHNKTYLLNKKSGDN